MILAATVRHRVKEAIGRGAVTTLGQLCHEWLTSLPAWSECARRGGGLTVTLVMKRLLYPDLVARWEAAPPLSAPLDDDQATHARSWLGRSGRQVERRLRLLRDGIDAGMQAALAREVEVSVTQLADKLARAIQSLEATGEPLTDVEVASVASTYLSNRPPKARVLSRRAFAEYEPMHLQRWDEAGAKNLAEFSYHKLGLGADERPPFVRRGRENTWDGLQRSVYSRFRMAAGDAHVNGSAPEVAHAEIDRSCARLGLQQEAGIVALTSLAAGFLFAPYDGAEWARPEDRAIDRTWRQETRRLEPRGSASADPRRPAGPWVHAEMASYAQACVAVFARRERQGRYLCHKGAMDEAREDAMRRAWMICFEHDRRQRDIDGRAGALMVSLAVFQGIPSGQAYRLRQRLVAIEGEKTVTLDSQIRRRSLPIDPGQLTVTLTFLAENRELANDVVYGHEEAEAEYERRALEDGLLPLETLLRYLSKDDES